jgi:hypothetical protein
MIASKSASLTSVLRNGGMTVIPRRTISRINSGERSVRSSSSAGSEPLYFAANARVPGLSGMAPWHTEQVFWNSRYPRGAPVGRIIVARVQAIYGVSATAALEMMATPARIAPICVPAATAQPLRLELLIARPASVSARCRSVREIIFRSDQRHPSLFRENARARGH